MLEQDYPSDRVEVIVADGQSTDDTCRRVRQLAAEYPQIEVVCIDNPGRIVPTGFNAALEEARGDVIVRVDGHTLIAPDYVQQCVAALERTGADNVGGRMNAEGETCVGRAVAAATSSAFGVGNARFHYSESEEWVDTVYLGAWRREVFRSIGPFDEEQVRNQDDEFNYRLLSAGGRILLSPRIRSRYFNRATFKSVAKQYFQYGFWKVRVMQKHPTQMRPRQFVPALFVLTLLALSAGMAISHWCSVLLLAALTRVPGGEYVRHAAGRSAPAMPSGVPAAVGLPGVARHVRSRFSLRVGPFCQAMAAACARRIRAARSGGMSVGQQRAFDAEQEQIRQEYRRREAEIAADVYAPWQPAEILMRMSRKRIAATMLRKARVFPQAGDRCLEVGYGRLGWLADLIDWGVRESDLCGIELDENRAASRTGGTAGS